MPDIARALLQRAVGASWPRLADSAIRALNERHVQIWLKVPDGAALLAERGWDGAWRQSSGDYLLVVDSNVGFNKVNAIVQASFDYTVDLSRLDAPAGRVRAVYTNPAQGSLPCQPGPSYGSGLYAEPIDRCYWNYLRVCVPAAARFIGGTPHDYPAEWMILRQPETGTITVSPAEAGRQSLATLVIVPFGSTIAMEFEYALPVAVLEKSGEHVTYNLRIQKQSGTQAMPVHLSVLLPAGAHVVSAAPAGRQADIAWDVDLSVVRDIDVMLSFSAP